MTDDSEIFYSTDTFYCQLRNIIRKMMMRDFRPDYIAAVSRGGLVPGVYLSHYFESPLITLVVDKHSEPVVNIALHQVVDALKKNQNVLLVDDICDKGTTLDNIWNTLFKMCPGIEGVSDVERYLHTAVLIYNEGENVFNPDYYGETINKHEDPSWIVFDWESWWN